MPQQGEGRPDWAQKWQVTHKANLERLNQRLAIQEPLQVVFYGDSITEHWNGVSMGAPADSYSANPSVLQEYFGPHGALALGIAGDRAPQVLARLTPEGGELPAALQPEFVWLLIGTNDYVSDGCEVDVVVAGNLKIVETIRQARPQTPIIVNSVLPRSISPDSASIVSKDDYMRINEKLQCYTADMESVYFVDVTYLFLDSSHNSVNMTLLPDGLHPQEEGSRVWAEAIRNKMEELRRDGQRGGPS